MSWNFSDWFTVGEGDKLLVSTLFTYIYLPVNAKRIAGVRSDKFYFGMSFNHKRRGKTMREIFEQAENEDNTKCTI